MATRFGVPFGEANVKLLGGKRDGRVVAGATTYASADVIGLSNVFGTDGAATWIGVINAVIRLVGQAPILGYERGADLDTALDNGFNILGPLRVWVN